MNNHINRLNITIALFLIVLGINIRAENDSLLFSIVLNDDSTSVFGCKWDDGIRKNLSGPVLMKNGNLLFYSQKGYVLYNKKGKLRDSHSLYKMNKESKNPTYLAYPLDSITILYYRNNGDRTLEVYQKELFKKSLKKVSGDEYSIYSEIDKKFLFNIASNGITDEMVAKSFLKPNLLGFTTVKGGMNWWAVDRLYSFTSPIIVEKNGEYKSFFPGLKTGQTCPVETHLIEPFGVFQTDGRWFYYGLYSAKGNDKDEYFQWIILCDQSGNILSSDRLLKQETIDAILDYNEKQHTNYTVRSAGKNAFVPAVDRNGFIYYGIIDYERKRINVFKRHHKHYVPVKTEESHHGKFVDEGNIAFSPIKLECSPLAQRGVFPEVILLNGKDVKLLDSSQVTKKGYYVRVNRYTDKKLGTRLKRTLNILPPEIQKLQDSIANQNTSWCPYSISLNLDGTGEIASLYYSFGDVIMCARVVEVTNNFEVFVRVDLDKWAEIIVFNKEGKYQNRFIFNRQHYQKRKDLIIIPEKREILERDFESDRKGNTFLRWVLQ